MEGYLLQPFDVSFISSTAAHTASEKTKVESMPKKQTTIFLAAAIAATTILSVTSPATASDAWTAEATTMHEVVPVNFKKKKFYFGHGYKGKKFRGKYYYGPKFKKKKFFF